jgi:diamine N-acetyltransferase
MTNVTLKQITRDNWREAIALSVHPDQERFVAGMSPPVALALAKAYVRPSGMPVVPFAIYADERMVGFWSLTYEPGSADNYWINHFLIDRRYQGRGYGKAALAAIVAMLNDQHPLCRSVGLTVHPDNHVAQRLYQSFGFVDTQEIVYGELFYRLALGDSTE